MTSPHGGSNQEQPPELIPDWRHLLAIASLPAVCAIPALLVHGGCFPSVAFGDFVARDRTWQIAQYTLPAEMLLGALLALWAARRVAGATASWPRRTLVRLGTAGLVGGSLLALPPLLPLELSSFGLLGGFADAVILTSLLPACSLGFLLLSGLPALFAPGLLAAGRATRLCLRLWITISAVIGAILPVLPVTAQGERLLPFVFNDLGLGAEAPGFLAMLAWIYFSWGAGLGIVIVRQSPRFARHFGERP